MRTLYDDSPSDTPPPADPREVESTRVGTPIRDAAVDPQPGDFLAPVNAGQANPHGPDVVSPGIHAHGAKPVVPGDVSDPARQEQRESELAERTLAGDEPVPDVVLELADGALDRKVDAADPDAEQRTAGQAAALRDAPATDGGAEMPAGNASTDTWRSWATTHGGMSEDEANSLSRDELRDRFAS